jgi:predicted ArsR family transcriptional regulator
MEILDRVIENKNLTNSEKILWLRLYLRHGTANPFEGTYASVAKDLKMKEMTVKFNMSRLHKKGMIVFGKVYSEGRGLCGMRYQLVSRAKKKS